MDWLEEKIEQMKKFLKNGSLVRTLVCYLCIGMAGVGALYWITRNLCLVWMEVLLKRQDWTIEVESFTLNYYLSDALRSSRRSWEWMLSFVAVFYHVSLYLYTVVCFFIVGKIFLETKIKPPMKVITQGLTYINMGDYSHEMIWESQDEMGNLCLEVEQMRKTMLQSRRAQWKQQEEQRKINAAFAHDIRTPLTVIRGYTEFLQKYVPSGRVTEEMLMEKLNTMQEQEERLLNFSTTMTTIQNMEKWEPSGKWYTVSEIMEELKNVAEGMLQNTGKEASLSTKIPEQKLFLDKNLLLEVFGNLLSNALRYARQQIQVETVLDGKTFTLFVKDDGPGFSEKALRRGLETYFSEEENSREHFGIGLFICRVLCENHGGNFSLQNSVQQGAIAAAVLTVGCRNDMDLTKF
ncbi:MAG: HAMP domain-containing histidine kinase [Lachnospiraceae bacterium]|nr:HAMP domain-containing histidine kinase [Lachnospiraceae bacterium]